MHFRSTHNEPLEHSDRPLLLILRVRDRGKQFRALTPVRCQRAPLSRETNQSEYSAYTPGNSVSETGERMNGGAVSDDRSPENEAILYARVQSGSKNRLLTRA